MGKIFYIMGKSSSGKDTLYQRLMKREDLHLKEVIPYTTRPIRANEENGREYFFCSVEKKNEIQQQGKIIEIRRYDTCHGIWEYFTADDGQINLEDGNYLMIGTLESYKKIKAYYKKEYVVPIYIEVEDGERLQRALKREMQQKEPKYEEMCRRFLADNKDFSEEKLKESEITKVFVNENMDDTEEIIYHYIFDMV